LICDLIKPVSNFALKGYGELTWSYAYAAAAYALGGGLLLSRRSGDGSNPDPLPHSTNRV
jgi:hypothetical protein